jgi:hypothetical protein
MTLIPTASKPPTFADVVAGKRQPSKERECYLLKRVPRGNIVLPNLSGHGLLTTFLEIRDQIWREFFIRPCGIVPGMVHKGWMSNSTGYCYHHRKYYGYHWDEARRRLYDSSSSPTVPPCFWYASTFYKTWTTPPTAEQLQIIEEEVEKLPYTIDRESGEEIKNVVLKHGNNGDGLIEIIHQMPVSVKSISTLGLMRTCKTIGDEVAQVLYGRNYFVFDARSAAVLIRNENSTEEDLREFEALRYRVRSISFKPFDFSSWQLTCCIDSRS